MGEGNDMVSETLLSEIVLGENSLEMFVNWQGGNVASSHSSVNGACSADPSVNITARSIKPSSSVALPGQFNFIRTFMVSVGTVAMRLFIRPANFRTKYLTSRGISSRRSRRDGIWRGAAFNWSYKSRRNGCSPRFVRSCLLEVIQRTFTRMRRVLLSGSNCPHFSTRSSLG